MATNSNTPMRNIGGGGPLPLVGNSGIVSPPSITMGQPSHHHPSLQSHAQGLSPFQGQFSSIQSQAQPGHGQFGVASSSPSLSSFPSSMSVKRIPQKPPMRPAAPTMATPFKTTDLTPAAKKKKRKLPDKQLPDRVAALLPESELYTQLLELESRVDAALARKKIDIQESMRNPPFMQRNLRIYVFNTYSNQTRKLSDKHNPEPPSWTLKIVGRILDDIPDADPTGSIPKPSPMYPKFSSFFKRITIALDPNLYPDNPVIVWENTRSPAQHEGFEIRRKGDKEFNVSIRLEMNHLTEKFRLSMALMEILGIEVETRPRIVAAIWHYVKAKKLQSPSDSSYFICDPPLRKVFGEEKMKFSAVSQKLSAHLSPPQAIHLDHRIRLSGTSPAGNACYDVLVDVPFPLQKEMAMFLANTEKHKEIDSCDEAICSVIKKIHEHRRRRAFFLGFSQSPVEFINALIASQSRDLKLLAGEAIRNAEKEHHSDFYKQPWVEDAIIRYLNRKPVAGSDAPPAGI